MACAPSVRPLNSAQSGTSSRPTIRMDGTTPRALLLSTSQCNPTVSRQADTHWCASYSCRVHVRSFITRHVWRMHLPSTSVAERGSVSMHVRR